MRLGESPVGYLWDRGMDGSVEDIAENILERQ